MISLDGFYYQNLYPLSSGELAVRPGLREEFAATTFGANAELVAGFSVRSPATGEVTHYLFSRDSSTEQCTLYLLDEEFQELQAYSIGPVPRDLVVTHAVITDATVANRELIICSPHFDTLYGIVGGGVTKATKVESVNSNTTAIEIPRGICASIAGRVVIGNGRSIHFSDALYPRTYTGINSGALDGNILSMHTISGGIVVVTEGGAWFLPVEAVGSAQEVVAMFRPLSGYRATGYRQTCVVDNVVFGLTANGLSSLSDGEEITLNEPRMPRALVEPVEVVDFRNLKLFASSRGPVVSNTYTWAVFDLPRKFHGWWIAPNRNNIDLVGVLTERDGSDLFITRSRILRAYGNSELDDATVTGVAAGRLPTSPEQSPVVREVTTSADGYGAQKAGVRGVLKSSTTPQTGFVLGTDQWTADGKLDERQMRSRRHLFAVRTDDITLEIAAENPGTRLGPIDVKTRGRGRMRYTN